jgi:hypothetical protein
MDKAQAGRSGEQFAPVANTQEHGSLSSEPLGTWHESCDETKRWIDTGHNELDARVWLDTRHEGSPIVFDKEFP